MMLHSWCLSFVTLLHHHCFNLCSTTRSNKAKSCNVTTACNDGSDDDDLKVLDKDTNSLTHCKQEQSAFSSPKKPMQNKWTLKEEDSKIGLSFAEANRKARIVYFIENEARLEIRSAKNGGFELRRIQTNTSNSDITQTKQQVMNNEDLKRFSTLLHAASLTIPIITPFHNYLMEEEDDDGDEAKYKKVNNQTSRPHTFNVQTHEKTINRITETPIEILNTKYDHETVQTHFKRIEKDGLKEEYENFAERLCNQLLTMDYNCY